jgi:hypothetical protein
MTLLIPPAELLAAEKRIREREAAKTAAGFVYQARPRAAWEARMNQGSRKYSRPQRIPVSAVAAPGQEVESVGRSLPPLEDRSAEPGQDTAPLQPQKVTQTTLCICGHPKKSHCAGAKSHPTESGTYWCVTEHCLSLRIENGKHVGDCECQGFRTDANAPVRMKRPKANAWTQCANPACGHWKSHHCRARKPSRAKKPKARDWLGFEDAEGNVAQCQHTPADNPAATYTCSSSSCAESADGKTFCPCEKFINPLTKPKKSKRQSLAEVPAELFQMAERL